MFSVIATIYSQKGLRRNGEVLFLLYYYRSVVLLYIRHILIAPIIYAHIKRNRHSCGIAYLGGVTRLLPRNILHGVYQAPNRRSIYDHRLVASKEE